MADFVETVTTATPVVLTMPRPSTDRHIQVTADSANTLAVATTETGQASATTQIATMSGETLIIDMIDVQTLTLTATGGNVVATVTGYRDS